MKDFRQVPLLPEKAIIEGGIIGVGDDVLHRGSGRLMEIEDLKVGRGSVFVKLVGVPGWVAGSELKKL